MASLEALSSRSVLTSGVAQNDADTRITISSAIDTIADSKVVENKLRLNALNNRSK